MAPCRYCWPLDSEDFPGHDKHHDHWYKTSPHDDRWGSFNPLNMDWWGTRVKIGCVSVLAFFTLGGLVVIIDSVIEWLL